MNEIAVGACTGTLLGTIWVAVSDAGVVATQIGGESHEFMARVQRLTGQPCAFDPARTEEARQQIADYLRGEQQQFDLPIDWSVLTPFQIEALRAAQSIPRGEVRTYGELALQLGKLNGARAVGSAMASNPMPLVLPCHRVLGADGSLHGYSGAGGIATKAWLLALEGYEPPQQLSLGI